MGEKRRRAVIGPELRARIVAAASAGESLSTIAAKVGVSLSAVSRIMRAAPKGLVAARDPRVTALERENTALRAALRALLDSR